MRAMHFAAQKHRDQRRKGIAAEPYVNHLIDVGRLVAQATAGRDLVAVLAAILHDTVEDTDITPSELADAFGDEVADVVVEVTDDKTLEKSERKRLQIETAASKSTQAKLIKIADKISNLRLDHRESAGHVEHAAQARVLRVGGPRRRTMPGDQPVA
jgi:(p)ppGpp synthase/HD superfamily hydrolase